MKRGRRKHFRVIAESILANYGGVVVEAHQLFVCQQFNRNVVAEMLNQHLVNLTR